VNKYFQNACDRISQPCPPIWFMRQAGRYHSHYQKLKEKYTFVQLCKTPELAAEVALGPVTAFNLDVAILFSDILFPAEGLGLDLYFNPGPRFAEKITHKSRSKYNNIERAVEHMKFQADAIKITREMLDDLMYPRSLVGFVGGPYTIAKYILDGDQHFTNEFMRNTLIPILKANIELQLEAGAEKVMIFDSGVGVMDDWSWEKTYIPLLKPLVNDNVGYYCRGKDITSATNYSWGGVGIDSTQDLDKLLRSQSKGFVQGNFDEKHLLLPKHYLLDKLKRYCDNIQENNRDGWVCGLGHGINKYTPEENVHLFVNTIRKTLS